MNRKSVIRGVWLSVAASITVAPALAGEEDVFDSDTFIDPREIGTELRVGEVPATKGKFSFTDAQAGYVVNFEDRSLLTDDDVGFLSIAHHRYRGAWQFGAKLSGIEGDRRGVRGEVSLGRYALNIDSTDDRKFVSRTQVGLTIDDFEGRDRELEVSGDLFVQALGLNRPLALGNGGFVYSYRFKEGPNTWRLQYKWNYNLPTGGWMKLNANAVLFFGYEDRDDRQRLTPIKAKFTLARQLGRKMQIEVVVAPIYQFHSAGYESGLHCEAYIGIHRLFSHDLD